MSLASEKGKSLEEEVASVLRKKLGARVARDKRSGAGSHQKMDLTDWYQDTRLDVEVKNHKTVSIKEWMRQAKAGASLGRVPTVVFAADDDVYACVPFADLVDLLVELKDTDVALKRAREPIVVNAQGVAVDVTKLKPSELKGTTTLCPGGFLPSPGTKKCLNKACPKCSNKKVKKAK